MVTDEKWSIRNERSFTWWAKDFPQTISVSEPLESRGFLVCRLTARTPILDSVATDERSYSLLSEWKGCGTANNASFTSISGAGGQT